MIRTRILRLTRLYFLLFFIQQKSHFVNVIWELLHLMNVLMITVVHIVLILQQNETYIIHFPYTAFKTIRAVGLIFLFYRALSYLLPVSLSLGPMLANIKQLVGAPCKTLCFPTNNKMLHSEHNCFLSITVLNNFHSRVKDTR